MGRPRLSFESGFVRGKPDECWEWKHGRCQEYGISNGRGAHRVSWEVHRGPIPEGMYVCHRCDNPPCVNPDHLFLGTLQDNIADRVAKGRSSGDPALGEAKVISKLTNAAVRDIRRRGKDGEFHHIIAARFGVSRTTICNVINRKVWSHVK